METMKWKRKQLKQTPEAQLLPNQPRAAWEGPGSPGQSCKSVWFTSRKCELEERVPLTFPTSRGQDGETLGAAFR